MMRFSKVIGVLLLAGIFLQAFSGFNLLKFRPGVKKNITKAGCPTINVADISIVHPDCNQSNGSISGIIVNSTGTKKFYTWLDFDNGVVGHSLDLNNIPAGVYTLEFTDNSGCTAPVYSSKIVVENANEIKIDDSADAIDSAGCTNNGAIKGLIVTGATNYEWHNAATGAIVSTSATSADLVNVNAGNYRLYASNRTCQLTTKIYSVPQIHMQVPTLGTAEVENPTCGGQGIITATLNIQAGQPEFVVYLTDAQGNPAGGVKLFGGNPTATVKLGALDGGNYNLYVEDVANCPVLLGTYTVLPGTVIISSTESTVVNDRCNQHLGFVIPVYYGATPPSAGDLPQYFWTDLSTHQVISRNKVLSKVGGGTYEFKFVDVEKCIARDTFTVLNVSPSLVPPKAAGSTLCLPGTINITVTNPDTAETFKLYTSLEDTIPVAVNPTGVFYRHVDQTTDFYVTRSHGDCESERTKVTEFVVADIKIPNAFTPNNDGINDYWNLTGIEKFPGADISVYNRYGQLVFHSINYAVPFNGILNGSRLPNGVYYYVMDVKQPVCIGKISGSLTIIR